MDEIYMYLLVFIVACCLLLLLPCVLLSHMCFSLARAHFSSSLSLCRSLSAYGPMVTVTICALRWALHPIGLYCSTPITTENKLTTALTFERTKLLPAATATICSPPLASIAHTHTEAPILFTSTQLVSCSGLNWAQVSRASDNQSFAHRATGWPNLPAELI